MIVIGDVHGQYDMLMRLLDKLPQTDNLCFVGDLIDRGPDSKKVLEFVRDNNYKCVLGNHEDMALHNHKLWMINGGIATINNFGKINDWLNSEWIEWIENLPLFGEFNYNDKRYLISHSFAYNAEQTFVYDVLWGRDAVYNAMQNNNHCLYDKKYDDGFINIFGHTPLKNNAKKILNRHWMIDTGATYNGKLTAINLINEQLYFV